MGEGYIHSNVKLSSHKSARNDDRENDTSLPPTILHTVFIGCWIVIPLGSVLWTLDENTFDRGSDVLTSAEEFDEHVTAGHANLEEGEDKHHQYTRPKEPVPRRRSVNDRVIVLE